MKKKIVAAMLALSVVSAVSAPNVTNAGWTDLLKVGGISILVDKFSEPLNNFINTLTAKHAVSSDYATKVVPIIVVGSGTYTGAAQVTGPQALVDQTKAVLQIEGNFSGNQLIVKMLQIFQEFKVLGFLHKLM